MFWKKKGDKMPTREEVLAELAKVKGPDLKGDIVSLGLVSRGHPLWRPLLFPFQAKAPYRNILRIQKYSDTLQFAKTKLATAD